MYSIPNYMAYSKVILPRKKIQKIQKLEEFVGKLVIGDFDRQNFYTIGLLYHNEKSEVFGITYREFGRDRPRRRKIEISKLRELFVGKRLVNV